MPSPPMIHIVRQESLFWWWEEGVCVCVCEGGGGNSRSHCDSPWMENECTFSGLCFSREGREGRASMCPNFVLVGRQPPTPSLLHHWKAKTG